MCNFCISTIKSINFHNNQPKNFRRVSYSTKEGIRIWYVLACKKQEEQKILTLCREKLPKKAYRDIFVLTYDRMRRYEGAWHLERHLLFPKYVFLESENEELLVEELGKCGGIDADSTYVTRIDTEEEKFLRSLCGEGHHLEMSRGVIREGSTQVTDGPLKGMENRIRRIDRHKRLARIEIAGLADELERYITAGLEIKEKVETDHFRNDVRDNGACAHK